VRERATDVTDVTDAYQREFLDAALTHAEELLDSVVGVSLIHNIAS
jgi:hypothetical protein